MNNWHTEPVDHYGNVACKKCGNVQSPSYKRCIKCCSHDNLAFDEEYDSGWRLTAYCTDCGKDIDNSELRINYKIIKTNELDKQK